MANERNTPAEPAPRFTAEIQNDISSSADFGITSKLADPNFSTSNKDAVSREVTRGEKAPTKSVDPKEAIEEVLEEGEQLIQDDADKDEPAPKDPLEEVVASELGEWDRTKPEVQDKFDAAYFKDGELNQTALSKEFWENYNKDPEKGGLNEATYAYLKDTLGISKETAKSIEKALVAEASIANEAFYKSVGGKEAFEAAVKWGREKGYTPAQRERFNKARAAGGEEFQDAVDALMARYLKANPEAAQGASDGRRGPPKAQTTEKRRSSPERSATSGANSAAAGNGAGGGDTFKSHAEYQAAWTSGLQAQKAAKTSEEKRAAKDNLDVLRRKARRSNFG